MKINRIYLYEDNEYSIYLSCDDGEADLDLTLYDSNDNEIGADRDTTSDAAMTLRVGRSGIFKLAVSCASGDSTYTMTIREQ